MPLSASPRPRASTTPLKAVLAAAIVAGALGASAAQAQQAQQAEQTTKGANVGVTLGGGTTGVGLHLAFPVAESINLRFGVNGASRHIDASTDDLDYRIKLKLNTFDVLLDWYPFGNAFRFSGGLMINKNRLDASVKPNGNGAYVINGNAYSAAAAGQIDGRVDFRRAAPYLGVGWGNAVATTRGWSLSADLGILFQGSPRTRLQSSGCTVSAAICAQLANDVQSESHRLTDEANDYKAYPVLRVGASYHF
ncbi:MAG: hypothetical protein QM674_03560 [Burkholderiaceae bacterium]